MRGVKGTGKTAPQQPDTFLPSLFTQTRLIQRAHEEPYGTDPFALMFTGKDRAEVVAQAYCTEQGRATPLGVEWLAEKSRP
jgi:hypothetical protein